MGSTLLGASQRQRMTQFRLFGPDTLIREGEPVRLKISGSRELLALLLLDPGRSRTVEELVDILKLRLNRYAERRIFIAAVKHLASALNGTGISVAWHGIPAAFGTSKRFINEVADSGAVVADLEDDTPRLALEGAQISTDLDFCGQLLRGAQLADERWLTVDRATQALEAIEGEPLEGLSVLPLEQAVLRRTQTLVNALAQQLSTVPFPETVWIELRIAMRNIPAVQSWPLFTQRYSQNWTRSGEPISIAFPPMLNSVLDRKQGASESLPVSIYLSDGHDPAAVEAALNRLLEEVDVETFGHQPPVQGSWFRRSLARVRSQTAHLSAEQVAAEIERKVRIEVFERQQAQIDHQQATGAAALIAALQGEERACVRVGSLLVIKIDGHVLVNNLTQYQMAWLERNQALLRDPEGLLKGLEGIMAEVLAEPGPLLDAVEAAPHALEPGE